MDFNKGRQGGAEVFIIYHSLGLEHWICVKVPAIRANRARERVVLKLPEVEILQGNLCLCHCLNVLTVEFSQVWTFLLSLVQYNCLFFSHHTSKRKASSIAASTFYFKAKEWLLLNITSCVPQTYNLHPAGPVGHMALPLRCLLLVFLTRLPTWTQYPPLIAFPASTLFLLSHIDQSQSAISSSPICLTSPTPLTVSPYSPHRLQFLRSASPRFHLIHSPLPNSYLLLRADHSLSWSHSLFPSLSNQFDSSHPPLALSPFSSGAALRFVPSACKLGDAWAEQRHHAFSFLSIYT